MTQPQPSLGSPPDYERARNRRQKQRAAGLHPDHWYPVLWDRELKVGEVREVTFWRRSIAVYRGRDGKIRALENRCAHRQLKLSKGNVEDCRLTCSYHGWSYDETGRCVGISHSLFGHAMPNVRVQSYPVRVQYGIVFVFPGDPALAVSRDLPEIPEWSSESGWAKIGIDFTWRAHHSIIIDNTCDFTHAYLHRYRRPFTRAELLHLETVGDEVVLEYDTQVGQGRFSRLLVNRKRTNMNSMRLGYRYPYQWSSTDEKIKHWCFVLPIDEHTTRAFFLFYFHPDIVQLPWVPWRALRRWVLSAFMPLAKRLIVRPLLDEDGVAVEAEQEGYEAHFERPVPDLNPVVQAFQALTIRKWEEHLASQGRGAREGTGEPQVATPV
ncbi:MAG TPA: aromatic ring-hydroxylating dioxygenase subunit alpha [Polyangiaceae bacterium]|nr:aromatic ring-hydroxylating dioxygenase subunit alpha [Polyangiaceae bacterium]